MAKNESSTQKKKVLAKYTVRKLTDDRVGAERSVGTSKSATKTVARSTLTRRSKKKK